MDMYMGTICAFGFNYAPYGWALCQGQLLPISQYSALFSLLGTYYGGNGVNNFALPNLGGRAAIHMGQLTGGSLYTIGEIGGTSSVTMVTGNMPAHVHTMQMNINANNRTADVSDPSNAFPAPSANTVNNYNSTGGSGSMKSPVITLGTSGGSMPISIDDPSLVMNYSIALQGIYPSRN